MEVEIEMGGDKKKKKEYGKYHKYEVERWVDVLMEAEEIKKDAEKMKYVQMCADKKKKAISSIADLKAKAKEVNEKESNPDGDEY